MTILVTGGAGFIGANFIYFQLNHHPDDKIICVDSLTYAGNLESLSGAMKNDNFQFIKADITESDKIEEIFQQHNIDIVVNFAAESHVDRSIKEPDVFLKTNILGTQVLLEMSKKYSIKRFHQVSTDEVYGDLPLDRKDLLFSETNPIQCSSPYSASKASADLLVLSYQRTFDLDVTISRCSNNYGPFHFPEKLIPLMIIRALKNESLPVYGNGENVRDWLFVEDHCSAIDLIMRKAKSGEIYNVGGNNEKTNLEIVKTILSNFQKSEDLIAFVKDRPGHDLRYAIDSTKLQKELNWKPQTSFENGMKMTIKWYLENQNWWERIINGEYQNYFKTMYGDKF